METQPYGKAKFEHGWSRNLLEIHIDTRLLERQGKAVTNFSKTLPPPQSDLAQQILKDPYNFDFLTLAPDHLEKEGERRLLEHVKSFLLELGVGFAFVGSQYPLEVVYAVSIPRIALRTKTYRVQGSERANVLTLNLNGQRWTAERTRAGLTLKLPKT